MKRLQRWEPLPVVRIDHSLIVAQIFLRGGVDYFLF